MAVIKQKEEKDGIHVDVNEKNDKLHIVYALKTPQSFIDADVKSSIETYVKYQKLRGDLGKTVLTKKDLKDAGLVPQDY